MDNKSPERIALDRIHAILDGEEWEAPTIEDVAEIITGMGYVIRDPNDPLPRPENVQDFRGGDEWGSALTDEQRATVVRIAPRYKLIQMEYMSFGTLMVTGHYDNGGIIIGIEPDGYNHT